jgi:nucleoside recognition membrane protein YjiH
MTSPSPTKTSEDTGQVRHSAADVAKFFLLSLIGIFVFFVPITANGTLSIPLDHMVTWITENLTAVLPEYALLIIVLGAAYPFVTGSWKKDNFSIALSALKVLGVVVAFAIYLNTGPGWLLADNIGPLLFDALVIPVGVMVPIGAVFLALLAGYGLLEFVGVLLQPVMRPVWKVPGRTAVNAVASFLASFAVGNLLTNRMYKEGKYTTREATIVVTGFATVTVAFMIVIGRTLEIMNIWNLYFWSTFAVTFLVTAVTVRIWPLSRMSDDYYPEEGDPEEEIRGDRLRNAWKAAMVAAVNSLPLGKNLWVNLRDGLIMTMAILPSIMSVGLIGLLLAEYTPVFDYVAYIFYPFTWALQIPEPFLVAKALGIEITEMFLPALLVVEAPLVAKFIIAVASVSAILFFSASIPSILATDIPVSIPKLLVIWLERTILSLIFVTPIAFLLT